jgi:hypothetical protein
MSSLEFTSVFLEWKACYMDELVRFKLRFSLTILSRALIDCSTLDFKFLQLFKSSICSLNSLSYYKYNYFYLCIAPPNLSFSLAYRSLFLSNSYLNSVFYWCN